MCFGPFQTTYLSTYSLKKDSDIFCVTSNLHYTTVSFTYSLKKDSDNSTGMLLYEIRMPSGFTVDIGAELRRNKHAKKVEMKKGSANYYFDDVSL